MGTANEDRPRAATEAYVRFVEPGQERRPSPYSVEGYIAGVGDFAVGAARARGWRRLVAKVVVVALLLPLAVAVVEGVITLLGLLLGN
jgi:hypothetical protein